jgi:hypothetical protein
MTARSRASVDIDLMVHGCILSMGSRTRQSSRLQTGLTARDATDSWQAYPGITDAWGPLPLRRCQSRARSTSMSGAVCIGHGGGPIQRAAAAQTMGATTWQRCRPTVQRDATDSAQESAVAGDSVMTLETETTRREPGRSELEQFGRRADRDTEVASTLSPICPPSVNGGVCPWASLPERSRPP